MNEPELNHKQISVLKSMEVITAGPGGRSVCGRSLAAFTSSNPVCCGRCVLTGRGILDETMSLLEGSYLVWCVNKRDQG
jgi:hypothetical protein